jgi:hypothetical protein
MRIPLYLWLTLALSGFAMSGMAQANDDAIPSISVDQYKVAIQGFGLDSNQAEQAAQVAVSQIEEIRQRDAQPEVTDAFANMQLGFLD